MPLASTEKESPQGPTHRELGEYYGIQGLESVLELNKAAEAFPSLLRRGVIGRHLLDDIYRSFDAAV